MIEINEKNKRCIQCDLKFKSEKGLKIHKARSVQHFAEKLAIRSGRKHRQTPLDIYKVPGE